MARAGAAPGQGGLGPEQGDDQIVGDVGVDGVGERAVPGDRREGEAGDAAGLEGGGAPRLAGPVVGGGEDRGRADQRDPP